MLFMDGATVCNLLCLAASLSLVFGESSVLRVVEVHADCLWLSIAWTHYGLFIHLLQMDIRTVPGAGPLPAVQP